MKITDYTPGQTEFEGAVRGVPEQVYHGLKGFVSQSMLKYFRDVPPAQAKFDMSLRASKGPSDSMILGSLVHTMLLSPDEFNKLYVTLPDGFDLRSEARKKQYGELVREYGPSNIIKLEVRQKAQKLANILLESELIAAMLESSEIEKEISLFWTDQETGLKCKGRIDMLIGSAAIDLKTTRSASMKDFKKSVQDFGYHIQAAQYMDGAIALGRNVRSFGFIAQETEGAELTAFYNLDKADIADGRAELRNLMEAFKQCQETGVYPGYPERWEDLTLKFRPQ